MIPDLKLSAMSDLGRSLEGGSLTAQAGGVAWAETRAVKHRMKARMMDFMVG